MKLRRVVLGAGAVVVVVVAAAVYFLLTSLDAVVERAIERHGSEITGTAVRVASVDISLSSGRGTVRGLTIANPEGFKDAHFLKLGGGAVAVDLGSLMGDEVVIPTLTLTGLSLNLERTLKGSNYGAILKNMEKGAEKTDEPGKKFVIKELIIRDVNVSAKISLGPAKPAVPLSIDEMRFENVGSGGSGARART